MNSKLENSFIIVVCSAIFIMHIKTCVRSFIIVSDYGLYEWGSIPGRGKGFFL
jgi:hypothetical protein